MSTFFQGPGVVNGDFVQEGTFLALPPSFPGVSRPLLADESRLHRIFPSTRGDTVYAISRGPRPHLLQWAPKSTYGYAVDFGVPEGISEIDAVVASPGKNLDRLFLTGWSHSEMGTVLFQGNSAVLGHGVQEWHVFKQTPEAFLCLPGIRILDLAVTSDGRRLLLLSAEGCLLMEWEKGAVSLMKEWQLAPVHTRFLKIRRDCWHVLADDLTLCGIDPERGLLTEESRMVDGQDLIRPLQIHSSPGRLVIADALGCIREWVEGSDHLLMRGKIPLLPVLGLCGLPDGRIFTSAGPDIAHWYVLGKKVGYPRDLGVPVSTLSVRRYGLQLRAILSGCDGEIYLAEDDRGGHLWVYFPPLVS